MDRSSPLHAPLSVATHTPVAPHRLRLRTDPLNLRFDPNEHEASSHFTYHQPRAEKALALGIQMRNAGHVFVCGPSGTARKTIIEAALERYAKPVEPLRDYLSVFPITRERQRPVWMGLPAGNGRSFLGCVDESVRACQDKLRTLILHCAQDPEEALDETHRRTWIRDVEEGLAARVEQFRRKGFDPDVTEYLQSLHTALAARMRESLELTLLHSAGNGGPQGLERLLDRAERLAEYRPQAIREITAEQVPVVFEPNPTFNNLFGCVGKDEARSDGSASERVLFQSGSLLKAQGGFLLLDFEEVAAEPDVWRHLKRCLRHEHLEIPVLETPHGRQIGLLKPDPIPLKVRLLAWGDERLYQEFHERDPAFGELFRIRADLDSQMDREEPNIDGYLAFLRRCRKADGLLPFDSTAAASFIDAGAELAGRGS